MSEYQENFNVAIEQDKKFPDIIDGNLVHRVIELTPEKLTLEIEYSGNDKRRGVYNKIHLDELGADFFVLDFEKSDDYVLPHGSACYLHEWDFILITSGPHGLLDLTKASLTNSEFTILAHELGHRDDYKKNDSKLLKAMTYDEREIRAWENAKKLFGDNPKFDHEYADRDIKSYTSPKK